MSGGTESEMSKKIDGRNPRKVLVGYAARSGPGCPGLLPTLETADARAWEGAGRLLQVVAGVGFEPTTSGL